MLFIIVDGVLHKKPFFIFYLRRPSAPEDLLAGVPPQGEFHENGGGASDGLLARARPQDEFHENSGDASGVLLVGVSGFGEIHLKNASASEVPVRDF